MATNSTKHRTRTKIKDINYEAHTTNQNTLHTARFEIADFSMTSIMTIFPLNRVVVCSVVTADTRLTMNTFPFKTGAIKIW